LMRSITSGRVMIISTKFRSDLFYSSEQTQNDAILKLWALYTHTDLESLNSEDIVSSMGAENSLGRYFHSINQLSHNWHYYQIYKKFFRETFSNDQENPVAKTVVNCDRHLVQDPRIRRTPLINPYIRLSGKLPRDTFSVAMEMMSNECHSN
jgi:hypothetical protein